MDLKSCQRISAFINDTETGSIYLHLKNLEMDTVLRYLGDVKVEVCFRPVIEIKYEDLKISAIPYLIDTKRGLKFGVNKSPITDFSNAGSVVDHLKDIFKQAFDDSCDFFLNTVFAYQITGLVVGLGEICKQFEGIQLVKEQIAEKNQVEFATKLYRVFGLHLLDAYCVSNSEITHNREKIVTIVPSFIDGAWLVYATKNNEIFNLIVDHHALWDGFPNETPDEPVYFYGQIRPETQNAFVQVLNNLGWSLSRATGEILSTFEARTISDLRVNTILDTILEG